MPIFLHRSLCRPFVGSARLASGPPGSASPSPGAITLSASFAGWLSGSLRHTTHGANENQVSPLAFETFGILDIPEANHYDAALQHSNPLVK